MATTKKQLEKKSGSAPVQVFRRRGVKVSVFENETETDGRKVKFYKTTVQKIYKEGEEFKTTNSLGRDDLCVARYLLQQAWIYILDAEAQANQPAQEGG